MRERRATVRVGCFLPAAYRPIESAPAVSTGRITNLSLEGLQLVAPYPSAGGGERVTVTFTLPHDEEPVSVTGAVRWSGPAVSGDSGRPLGLEFQELDETTRFCVQAFVADQTKSGAGDRGTEGWQDGLAARLVRVGWPLVVAIVSAGMCVWILRLQQQQERLRRTLSERTSRVIELNAQHQQLAQQLDQARAAASLTQTQIGQLQVQRASLETELEWMGENLGELKQAYLKVREERDALMDGVRVLQQQQAALEQRLMSLPAPHTVSWRGLARLHAASPQVLQGGNHGYLIREGQSTSTRSANQRSIHVLTPESSSGSSR